jgi:serine/threonine protein phosphatase PrpC
MGLPGNLKDWAFFAVFDGHAGERVSSHCADNLLETIIQTEQFSRCANEEDVSLDEIKKGIREGGCPFHSHVACIETFDLQVSYCWMTKCEQFQRWLAGTIKVVPQQFAY